MEDRHKEWGKLILVHLQGGVALPLNLYGINKLSIRMAIGCRFSFSGLWFCFVAFRICHAHEFVQD